MAYSNSPKYERSTERDTDRPKLFLSIANVDTSYSHEAFKLLEIELGIYRGIYNQHKTELNWETPIISCQFGESRAIALPPFGNENTSARDKDHE
jgi:hypothetical protein